MPQKRVVWSVVAEKRKKKLPDGTFTKYRNTYYAINYWSGDVPKRIRTGLTNRAEAYRMAERLAAEGVFNGAPLFEEYATGFYDDGSWYVKTERADRNNPLRPGFLRSLRSNLRLLIREWEGMNLKQLTTEFLDRWFLDKMVNGKKMTGTLNHYKQAVSPIFDKAVKDKILTGNPTKSMAPLGVKETKKEAFSNWSMYKFFMEGEWKSTARPYYWMALLSASCGLRIGEVQALRVNDIEAGGNTKGPPSLLWINVDENYIQGAGQVGPPKAESSRCVPVVGLVVPWIMERVRELKKKLGDVAYRDAFLFSKEGTLETILPQAQANYHLKKYFTNIHGETMPRKYSIHCLRRWFNTRAVILTKTNEFLVGILMGHKKKGNMTGLYNKVSHESYVDWVRDMQPHLWGDEDENGLPEFLKEEAKRELDLGMEYNSEDD